MYLNAYKMVEMVREGVNEFSDAYVQGTDTTGSFRNQDILDKINLANQDIANMLLTREPQHFQKSIALTGVASVYTPPGDFFKALRWEDANGSKVWPIGVDEKSAPNQGIGIFYYKKADTMILDKLGGVDVLTLHYLAKVRDLDFGAMAAGGSLSVTLATTARPTTSYYVGMSIVDVTDVWEDTITAYTSGRVCTIAAQTGATGKYYGIVPELPEALHPLIPMKALLLMKGSHKSLKPPTQHDLQEYADQVALAFSALLGTKFSDVDYNEMFS